MYKQPLYLPTAYITEILLEKLLILPKQFDLLQTLRVSSYTKPFVFKHFWPYCFGDMLSLGFLDKQITELVIYILLILPNYIHLEGINQERKATLRYWRQRWLFLMKLKQNHEAV